MSPETIIGLSFFGTFFIGINIALRGVRNCQLRNTDHTPLWRFFFSDHCNHTVFFKKMTDHGCAYGPAFYRGLGRPLLLVQAFR